MPLALLTGAAFAERLNGDTFLQAAGAGQTVFDDGARDDLAGGAGADWLLLNRNGPAPDAFAADESDDLGSKLTPVAVGLEGRTGRFGRGSL